MRTSPPPTPEMTCGFLIQLYSAKNKTMWFVGVEVEQETSAPHPKKNPGSAPWTCTSNNMLSSSTTPRLLALAVVVSLSDFPY